MIDQWNAAISKLTSKLPKEEDKAVIGAAPTIKVSLDQLSHCTPSAASIQTYTMGVAIDQMILLSCQVSKYKVFGQSDGGQNGQEVRLLSLHNADSCKIVEFWSGLTFCGKESDQVAVGMK